MTEQGPDFGQFPGAADGVIAVLNPSPGRRWLGILMFAGLALVLFYLASQIPFGISQLAVVILAGFMLWGAQRLHIATQDSLELTRDELRIEGGARLCEIAQMTSVDRGAFAFKPSNGFVVRLKERHGRAWAPGLYWRGGRRMGIGGVTSAGQGKFMAEAIATLISERQSDQV